MNEMFKVCFYIYRLATELGGKPIKINQSKMAFKMVGYNMKYIMIRLVNQSEDGIELAMIYGQSHPRFDAEAWLPCEGNCKMIYSLFFFRWKTLANSLTFVVMT
jgi:hypothetical protein